MSRKTQPMRLRAWFAAVGLIVLSGECPVFAHSWYPSDCCSERDCMPADSIVTDAHGYLLVTVGKRKIWVPPSFQVRPSPDGRIHICFSEEPYLNHLMPLCLFLPAQS